MRPSERAQSWGRTWWAEESQSKSLSGSIPQHDQREQRTTHGKTLSQTRNKKGRKEEEEWVGMRRKGRREERKGRRREGRRGGGKREREDKSKMGRIEEKKRIKKNGKM